MILLDSQITAERKDIGSKALNLWKLQHAGFLVPRFAIISVPLATHLWRCPEVTAGVAAIIHHSLGSTTYAVRSSALIEDQLGDSKAGIFMSATNVVPEHLDEMIQEVLRDASAKMNGQLKDFALIVQSYIDADRSGVTFTRSPDPHPLMVMEWVKGRGEALVGGQIRPYREVIHWDPDLLEYEDFRKIERLWGWPQDIEWCEKDGKRYILQTRPITTITSDQYETMKECDRMFPSAKPYWFEKSELSAAAPRPSRMMLKLLERIYGNDGPVQRVYQNCGVQYFPRVFWKLFLGELYVDREAEMQTLFPACALKSVYHSRPVFGLTSWRKLFTTLKNQLALQRLKLDDHEYWFERLREEFLNEYKGISSSKAALNQFLQVYEMIFSVNLRFTRAMGQLQAVLGKDRFRMADLLRSASFSEEKSFSVLQFPEAMNWKGNGIDLDDLTPFTIMKRKSSIPSELLEWWKQLSSFRRNCLLPFLQQARRWQELREYARWLTVKYINILRPFFPAEKSQAVSLLLPSVFTTFRSISETNFTGVSGGSVHGVLVHLDFLDEKMKDIVLYSPQLSPSLAELLPRVKGIVAENGGMLSHVAILAREKNIPVLVGVSFSEVRSAFGKSIHIDGTKCTWTLLES